jgi:hypothetical protein
MKGKKRFEFPLYFSYPKMRLRKVQEQKSPMRLRCHVYWNPKKCRNRGALVQILNFSLIAVNFFHEV